MSISANITELGTRPVGKLLWKYAMPAVIAMTASSLYNIIDAIYIGQGVGTMGIAGVSLSFPVMQVTTAFGAMVGVGASTLLSVKLGEKDYESARNILGNVLVMNIIMGIAIGTLMMVFLDPILYLFGASEHTVSYARAFMQVILLGNVVTHLYYGMNNLLRASGHPRQAMVATIASVLFNTALAPLFIYVFDWGIKGAAAATVLSQALTLLWQIHLLSDKREFIHFSKGIYRLQGRIVWGTLAIGLSPFLMNLCSCLVTILYNWSLAHYGGDLEIAAYGIALRLSFLFCMIVMGLNQGMQPIAGYNFGARRYGRMRRSLVNTSLVATVVMVVGFAISQLFPEACARAFTDDPALVASSARAIRLLFLAFPIIGFQMVTINFFQCIGKVKVSIFLSMTRQLLMLIPLIYFLPLHFGLEGIWYSAPVSDALSTFLTSFFLVYALRKFRDSSSTSSSIS